MVNKIFIFFFGVLIFSCTNKQQENTISLFQPKVISSSSTVYDRDSLESSAIVSGKLLPILPVGKPISVKLAVDTFHFPAPAKSDGPNKFREVTPGVNGVLKPKETAAIPEIIVAGIPEVILAKDMGNKNINPANFSYFKILQGLKHNASKVLYTSKNGDLWIGSGSNGVCRFDGKYFTYFTEKEGLAGNSVLSIFEDSNGYLWFGSNGSGVSCYNGREFKNFTTNNGLMGNIVTSIGEDKDKNIWIGTATGLSVYNGSTFFSYSTKNGLPDDAVLSILLDKNNRLWLGTNNKACFFDGTSFSIIDEGISGIYIYALAEGNDGSLWFGTFDGGVTRYNGKTFERYTVSNGLTTNVVWSLAKDKNGNIWAGTDKGITKFENGNTVRFDENDGLTNNAVRDISVDNNGELWFATDDGLNRYDGELFNHYTDAVGLPNNNISGVMLSKKGIIWVATNGGGVCYYDSLKFHHFGAAQGFDSPVSWGMFQDSKENIWLGVRGGGTMRYKNDSIQQFSGGGRFIFCHYEDKFGNMWFGSSGEGVTKFDGKVFTSYTSRQGLSDNTINCIFQDKKGNMWLGTKSGGVTVLSGKKAIQYTTDEGLSNNFVNCFYEDKNGNIWIGTNGGLNIYDGKMFTQFTEKQGLASNFVTSFLEDSNGNVWIGTGGGISKISAKNLQKFIANNFSGIEKPLMKNYGFDEGFLGINCVKGAVAEDKNGFIWWGTSDRLTRYNPTGDIQDTIAPPVSITSIKLYNEIVAWNNVKDGKDTTLANGSILSGIYFDSLSRWYNIPENLSLPYDNNYVTFNFIGLHLKSSSSIIYQYKLEGLEKKWSTYTKRTEIPYTNLAPGNYTFKVKAMNKEGYWSTPFAYTFKIRPPWWQTWWFRVIVIFLVIFSVRYYIKWREKTLKQRQKLLEKTVDERTAEVSEQKFLIEEKQKEIIDSINYAKRIQYTLLAHEKVLKKQFEEHFVLFKPKDIVSGDFYWATKVRSSEMGDGRKDGAISELRTPNTELFYLAVCDSTGHGVPGAFMSLLNISFLNEAITERNIYKPNQIFNYVRERLTHSISKEGNKDGFDGILLCIEKSLTEKNAPIRITYAASNNAPVIINNGILTELAADRMPVGVGERKEEFNLYSIDFEKGDMLYLFTDGYADQFGGPKGKKFKYKKLNEVLVEVSAKELNAQCNILTSELENWKGTLEQVDDVLIIGIKL